MLIYASLLTSCNKEENNPAAPINHPPNMPTVVSPANGATNQSISLSLRWSCTDPDGDPLTYDIYFDKNNPPITLVSSNQADTSLARDGLDTSATYYWRIVAKDSKGASTTGNVWSFATSSSIIPTQGLVAYYPFNGNTNDESGNGHNGFISGATLTTDRFGRTNHAYCFDGTSNFISVPNDVALNPSSVTVLVWAKGQCLQFHKEWWVHRWSVHRF